MPLTQSSGYSFFLSFVLCIHFYKEYMKKRTESKQKKGKLSQIEKYYQNNCLYELKDTFLNQTAK